MITNNLRKVIDTHLAALPETLGIKEVGYRRASDQKMYPHIVWDITRIDPTDMGRADYTIDFDVWDKSEVNVFNIMDAIVKDLSFLNEPDSNILPTFFNASEGTIDDPDKTIVHGLVRIECQVYDTGVTDKIILEKEQTNGNNH